MADGHWPGGERLDRDTYFSDFEREYASLSDSYLKLERAQHFVEPGNPSWELFDDGDWDGALALIPTKLAPDSERNFADMRSRGLRALRLRVVALPASPYVQWELHVLRMQAEHGEDIRIITEADFQSTASDEVRQLPELLILDQAVMYEILYDAGGACDGSFKYTDKHLVTKTRQSIEGLFADAEPLRTFFEEAIAPLPPPHS